MVLNFRKLRADEIDVRVAQIGGKDGNEYADLLLYKDARVDMNILDETVGAMNWQRSHTRENANCIVSIWDEAKSAWIAKEDTGSESNTEPSKGLASDSFKRACFNWGIGRELYTAPRIRIFSNNGQNFKAVPKGAKKACYDRFIVSAIGYNERGEISTLEVKNEDNGKAIFKYRDMSANKTENKPKAPEPIKNTTEPVNAEETAKIRVLRYLSGKEATQKYICNQLHISSVENMTEQQARTVENTLRKQGKM